MSATLDRAIQIIDSSAQQLLTFLQFNKKSTNLLVNEILNETDFNEKLSKLINLLMDFIKCQSYKSINYFDELISELILFYPSIPRNSIDFSRWIKQKLAEASDNEVKYKEAEDYLIEKLKKCKKQIQIAKKLVDAYNINQLNTFEENTNIEYDPRNEIQFNNEAFKLFSKENYQEKNEHIQEQNFMISSLRQEVNLLQNKVAEKKSIIKALKAKISNDSNEILEIRKQNEEFFLTNQNSNETKDEKIEELIQINQKLRNKIKKKKEKIVLLRDKGNAKINKYKTKIDEQKRKIDSMDKEISNLKEAQIITNSFQNEKINLIEKCEKLSKKLEKSKKIIHKYEIEKEISNINNDSNKQQIRFINANENHQLPNRIEINKNEIVEDSKSQLPVECNGCIFDVDELKDKFNNLENSIEKLRSTLIKPNKLSDSE